jgi:hypothetical protein
VSNASRSHWLIATLLFVLCPLAVRAQDNKNPNTSVTGCLQKGVESGGLILVGEDGKVRELFGRIDAKHVGHKVTVSGHELHLSPANETKHADNEKQESAGKVYEDFHVGDLKMVSDSCE